MANKKKTVKRGNNEGCIMQRKDGRWCAMISLGYDDNGRRIRKTIYGKTKAEVSIKLTTESLAKASYADLAVKNESIQILMNEWLLVFKQAEVSPRTFERCCGNATVHIYPAIGRMKIHDVTPMMAQSVLNKMLIKGYALASVRKVKFLMSQFFAYAKSCKWIKDNPVAECVVKATSEHKAKTNEVYKAIPIEIRKPFIDALEGQYLLKPLCLTMMFGGLRTGETLALKWKDVDLVNDIISVDNSITIVPEFDDMGNVISRTTVISDTKTAASVREVPIPKILRDALEEHKRNRWAAERSSGISLIADDDLVFGTLKGELRTYSGIKSQFIKFLKSKGFEKYRIRFHTLRHTYSSMLFEARENPKVIQMLLGHKDVTTTIRTYNSVDRSYFRQATDKLDAKFSS